MEGGGEVFAHYLCNFEVFKVNQTHCDYETANYSYPIYSFSDYGIPIPFFGRREGS